MPEESLRPRTGAAGAAAGRNARSVILWMTACAVICMVGAVGAQEDAPVPEPAPIGTMSELMVKLMYPASDAIIYVESRAPTNEVEWNELQAQALILAESANLIMMPSRVVGDRDQWMRDARLMFDAGAAAYEAALDHDLDAIAVVPASLGADDSNADVWDRVEHHTVTSGEIDIHYVTLGEGKPVLFLHGFPDLWYSWRHQMAALEGGFRTAAMDLRGYNRSGQPKRVEDYQMPLILGDVAAVIEDLGAPVTLVGHDWGGAIAWRYAMANPEQVERLVILNLTHPRGYGNVIANATEAQRQNTEYARRFATSKPDGSPVPERLVGRYESEGEKVAGHYREAFSRSYWDGMLNYYRANYGQIAGGGEMPNLQMPVLQFHGLKDTAVDKDGLKNTWDWIDRDYTLVTAPSVGHWVQLEAADLVSNTMRAWLLARE